MGVAVFRVTIGPSNGMLKGLDMPSTWNDEAPTLNVAFVSFTEISEDRTALITSGSGDEIKRFFWMPGVNGPYGKMFEKQKNLQPCLS